MDKAPGSAKIGEHGRILENPLWIMPPEALTQSFDVERWFIRLERYFRAADVPDNHRAATVQYHMDEAMGDVLSAMEVEEIDDYDKLKLTLFRIFDSTLKRLLPKAFPQLKDQADDILLQKFKAEIHQDMIKFTILPDSFEKRVRKKIMINQVTASNAVVSADAWKETSDHEDETKTGAVAAIHAEQPSDIDKLAMKVKELLAGEINATVKTKLSAKQRPPHLLDM
ncbi:hypothetical protein T01_9814 [Trichinella spiralis]|uniref:Uncharacterized protein n=1 Tax=Trichinella spiralis TaxID=6334 RepID=A0A0V1BTX1_TRISP|nr:hypothetical protein T01_9814 [Trichinella spiralis]